MKADWHTPPGGDFVRYVEQLTARSFGEAPGSAPLPSLFDDAEAPAPLDATQAVAARRLGSEAPATAPVRAGWSRELRQGLMAAWAAVLAVLLLKGALLWGALVLIAGLWISVRALRRGLAQRAAEARADGSRPSLFPSLASPARRGRPATPPDRHS